MLSRGSVVLVELDPTAGNEQWRGRPCVVLGDPVVDQAQRFPVLCVAPVDGTLGVGALYPHLSPTASGFTKVSCALVDHRRSLRRPSSPRSSTRPTVEFTGQLAAAALRAHRPVESGGRGRGTGHPSPDAPVGVHPEALLLLLPGSRHIIAALVIRTFQRRVEGGLGGFSAAGGSGGSRWSVHVGEPRPAGIELRRAGPSPEGPKGREAPPTLDASFTVEPEDGTKKG